MLVMPNAVGKLSEIYLFPFTLSPRRDIRVCIYMMGETILKSQ